MQTSKRRFLAALAAAPAVLAAPALAAVPTRAPAPRPASAGRTAPTGQPAPAERLAGSAADQEGAGIAGIPDARFPADRVEAFRAALGTAPIVSEAPWLALSTGGENGAFGAGVLSGWTESGTRPRFGVVTGVSTGALIAPFAFLGPRWDEALRLAYTAVTAADIFEIGATETSLLDTWPLARMIARFVTSEMLAAVAVEHAAGRRLFVVTTNLDTGRPVAWNMGAIAAKGDAPARKLFCDVLLASGSIPGLFPAVTLDVEAEGRKLQEMHADGGVAMPFFVAPEGLLTGAQGALPTREVYVLVNNRLDPEFAPTQRALISVLGNALGAAVKAGTRASLAVHAGFARAQGIALRVATIGPDFKAPSSAPFDPAGMRALYDHAHRRALAGRAFDAGAPTRLANKA